jgi:glutamate carboxypeptidase
MHHLVKSGIVAPLLVAVFIGQIAGGAASAETNRPLLDRAVSYQPEALALLGRIVSIESETGDEKGVNEVGTVILEQLKALSPTIEHYSAAPAAGTNLVASFHGTGKGRILVIAHMDTVFPAGTVKVRPFTIKDGRATGPGVADDKGGIIVALFAMKALKDVGFSNFAQVTLLFNTNEETGSYGTRDLITRLSSQHDFVLNVEPGDLEDAVKISRKGRGVLEIDVTGKASHAGGAPEKGRNAAMELSHQVLKIPSLQNKDKGTSANLTVLKTEGDQTNVIPAKASALADVRVTSIDEFDRVEKAAADMVADKIIPDTTVVTSLARDFPPLAKNESTEALSTEAKVIYAELGKNLSEVPSSASSDSGFAALAGTPILDGLGAVGSGQHSVDEALVIDSIAPRIYLLARLIMELGASSPAHR